MAKVPKDFVAIFFISAVWFLLLPVSPMHRAMQIKASLNKVWILFHQFFSCERTIEQLRLLKSITFTLLNYFNQHTGGEVIEEMKLLK